MRRFLITSCMLLALILSAGSAAPAAHAQYATNPASFPATPTPTNSTSQSVMSNPDAPSYGPSATPTGTVTGSLNPATGVYSNTAENASAAAVSSAVATQNAAAASAAQNTATNDLKKGAEDKDYNMIMIKIMGLFAWLVGVAAITLDWAVFYTVVNMGNYIHNLTAVGVTWRILRDLGNIMLIFGFLAAGIMTILNTTVYGWNKSMIPKLLIAAVFLNFSLFISEAVIDVGNLFATQFYTQINGGIMPTAATLKTSTTGEGISNKLMSKLGLQAIYGDAIKQKTELFNGANPWFVGFMGVLLFLVTAFVMFSLAFILIARFVILIFLIILAPVGFAGLAVPALAGRAKQWWSKLVEQTITAPVLFLMLYVALYVILDNDFLTGFGMAASADQGVWTGFVNNLNIPGFAGMMLSFLVAMGLLLLVTITAKSLSATGAGWATATAGKLTFGATAWGLNRTVGAGSRALAQRMRTSGVFANTRTGRALIRGAEYGAKSSFDIRGSKMFGGVAKIGGIDAGEVAKGGYQGARDRATKKHEEFVKATDAALDERNLRRGTTKEDRQKEEAAIEKLATAEQVHTEAKNKHAAAAGEYAQNLAEIKKIEEEKVTNATQMDEKKKRLEAAKVKAATSEVGLATAKEEMEFAKENLDKVTKEVKDKSGKKMKDAKAYQAERVTEEKKEQKLAYADSISGLSSILLSGPGSAMAAKKIIKDAKKTKSDDEELLEKIKKVVEKKDEKPAEEKPEAEEPRPTAH